MEAELLHRRFDPAFAPALEQDLEQQVSCKTHHFEANTALLMLYQLHPNLAKEDVVVKAAAKALMCLPNTQFTSCMYLLSSFKSAKLELLAKLAEMLESAQFAAYWALADSKDVVDIIACVPGFEDAIRTYICGVLTLTYKKLDVANAQKLLHVNEAALAELAKAKGWPLADGTVVFPEAVQGQQQQTVKQAASTLPSELASLDQMSKILASIQN
eukprot:TRINITY_DN18397_c0_g1_i1.p1 TRINITY_DN18397_c0_g1~~TRINITY_DN18397_c0_g1_i1.p1  ORF type:complete len:215 (-),score=89.63 TRINITY_DN18397_c0_g1_i1:38-682(-)